MSLGNLTYCPTTPTDWDAFPTVLIVAHFSQGVKGENLKFGDSSGKMELADGGEDVNNFRV